MALQPGILTTIEERAIAVLVALNNDDSAPLFKNIEDNAGTFQQIANTEKCVDSWLGQIGTADGGIASFERYCAFAFVRTSIGRASREGDYDANLHISLDIAVGQMSEQHGICRIGDADTVGINRIFEKVFLAFDEWHPGSGMACDPFYLAGATELVVHHQRHAIQLHFEANWIPITT